MQVVPLYGWRVSPRLHHQRAASGDTVGAGGDGDVGVRRRGLVDGLS